MARRKVATVVSVPAAAAQAALALERAVEAQLTLDLPRPPQVSTRPFRSELTLERASLFVADSYKGDFFEREVVVRDALTGEPMVTRLIVGKVHAQDRGRGVLRVSHRNVLYKLFELWGQLGYPVEYADGAQVGLIRMSAYQLVSSLFPGDDSARAYRRTQELLQDLQGIPIFFDNVASWQGLMTARKINILEGYEWYERRVDRKTHRPVAGGSSCVTVKFSVFITDAFRARYTKTLLGKPLDSISGGGKKSAIADALYPELDEQLTDKESYQASLQFLAVRYGFRTHAQPSRRKEQFVSAVRVLDGVLIVEGKYRLRVELQKSPDDYLFCARREPLKVDSAEREAGRGKLPGRVASAKPRERG
ncbi:MAG: hypothetical protein JWN04_2906 [Myxococcaceae bacterium]|nr:hypothetical protein [Myxococcaceae bacterium]